MNARTIWSILAGLMIAVVLAGCQDSGGGMSTDDSHRQLVAQSPGPITDVPLPLGFTFEQDESSSDITSSGRVVDYRYSGQADKWLVSQLYCRLMPENGWTSRGERVKQGVILLDYYKEKTNEVCRIEIGTAGLIGRIQQRPTVIHIELRPSGQGQAGLEQ